MNTRLTATLSAYLQMFVHSHLETTANDVHQESHHTVEHAFKGGKHKMLTYILK